MSAPNLLSPTTVTGKVAGLLVTGSAVAIVSNASSSGQSINVRSLYVTNVTASTTQNVTVDVFKGASTAYRLAYQLVVAPNTTQLIITSETPVTLEENDSLRLTASATTTFEAVATYDVIS